MWNRSSIEIVGDNGRVFRNLGDDKRFYDLIQMLGKHHGEDGVFEIIIKKGVLTHQRFIPGGVITGYPNQKVPGISGSVSPVKPWWQLFIGMEIFKVGLNFNNFEEIYGGYTC